jgi:hypothetical protein
MRHRGPRAQEHGAQIDIEIALPVVFGHGVERTERVDRGHVDEDVEASELAYDLRNQRRAVVYPADVRGNRRAPSSGGVRRGDGRLGLVTRSAVGHGDVRPALGQLTRDHPSDALPASDQHDAIRYVHAVQSFTNRGFDAIP